MTSHRCVRYASLKCRGNLALLLLGGCSWPPSSLRRSCHPTVPAAVREGRTYQALSSPHPIRQPALQSPHHCRSLLVWACRQDQLAIWSCGHGLSEAPSSRPKCAAAQSKRRCAVSGICEAAANRRGGIVGYNCCKSLLPYVSINTSAGRRSSRTEYYDNLLFVQLNIVP
jgi:hypothetical protein